MIKLIAIDLDGTLCNDDGSVSKENLKALHYAQEKGIKVVIATGRPYLSMKHLIDQIGLTAEDYIIIFNGAQVRAVHQTEPLISTHLTTTDLAIWMKEAERLGLPLNLVDNEWVYEPLTYKEGQESIYIPHITQAPATHKAFESFDTEHTFSKFVIGIHAEYLMKQLQYLSPALKDAYSIALSHTNLLEIMKKGTHKAIALRDLGKLLEIPLSNMMAIGDQNNDVQMLQEVAIGVAMGNATEEVKALADDVTLTNNEAGVAHAIYKYI